ncbi:MAG: UV DNA damage repair endonuclease UvsE [Chloroflexi bacterium]|nr:MAG: UV DNA damage repair endonuclease UvsE [Chloroflexota bacterium]
MTTSQQTPQLGLVCITASQEIRFRTTTRTQLMRLSTAEQAAKLAAIYRYNLDRLSHALSFCLSYGIRLYRISSDIFPFADTPQGKDTLASFHAELWRTGQRALDAGMRLVFHPDQFVVLSSDSPTVVANSITILQMHAEIMDLLGQPRSAWATVEIHGGKAGRAEQLVNVIRTLPEGIRSRLALENDESAYSAGEILEICRAAGVPMVFDAHHHIVHEQLDTYEHLSIGEMVTASRGTWPHPQWQLVHISNGRAAFADRRHADLITAMPTAYRTVPWIEIEAKQKEVAIFKLQQEWLSVATGKA